MSNPLVLGIGNLLLGDEGVGVHAVRQLEGTLPAHVTLLDGGTGGFHLLGALLEHDPVFLIDATLDGKAPGTVSEIVPKYSSDFPPSLSAHDIGLKDLIDSAAILGRLPTVTLLTVSVQDLQPMEITMSPAVEAAIPELMARIHRLLDEHSAVLA